MSLACRHHIHELIVPKVFETLMEPSSGPHSNFFQRLSAFLTSTDKGIYDSGMEDHSVASVLEHVRSDVVYFIRSELAIFQPRDDYKELLQLVLLFPGSETEGIQIVAPETFHRDSGWSS